MKESRVTLSVGEYTIGVHPIYGSGVKHNHKRESGQMYYRDSLDGSFRFVKDDFRAINAWPENTKFTLRYYLGDVLVGMGNFYKEDCKMSYDDEICEVKISSVDRYTKILEGLNNTYNLVKLAPEMHTLTYKVRPVLQLYVLGSKKLSYVFANQRFETDCDEVEDESHLMNDLHFSKYTYPLAWGMKDTATGDYAYWCVATKATSGNKWMFTLTAINESDRTPSLYTDYVTIGATPSIPLYRHDGTVYDRGDLRLFGAGPIVVGSDITDVVSVSIYYNYSRFSGYRGNIYARWIFAKDGVSGAFDIPDEDIVDKPRNYKYCLPAEGEYSVSDYMQVSFEVQDEPTEYGTNSSGKYFVAPKPTADPSKYGVATPLPICWDQWLPGSYWFMSPCYEKFWIVPDLKLSQDVTLKDAYDIVSVLKVLMKEVDPSVIVEDEEVCSEFFCSYEPSQEWIASHPHFLRSIGQVLYITPITNVKATQYTQAAQRGDITLGQVFDMMRGFFRCYWWIDDDNRLRIEHITAIRNGGSYTASAVQPAYDLTQIESLPTDKTWAFQTGKVEKASSKIARFEFDWSDEATSEFKGYALDVNRTEGGSAEKVSVSNFNSDLDFIVANPEAVSNDSFALLGADRETGIVGLSVVGTGNKNSGAHHGLQNGHLSFLSAARNYYLWDMYNTAGILATPLTYSQGQWNKKGSPLTALALAPNRKQTVIFPMTSGTGNNIIRTGLGDGQSIDASVDCSSGVATVNLDMVMPMGQAGSVVATVEKEGASYRLIIRNLCDKRIVAKYVLTYPGYVSSEYSITLEPEEIRTIGTTTTDNTSILVKSAEIASSQPDYVPVVDTGCVFVERGNGVLRFTNNSAVTVDQYYAYTPNSGLTWYVMFTRIVSGGQATITMPNTYQFYISKTRIIL